MNNYERITAAIQNAHDQADRVLMDNKGVRQFRDQQWICGAEAYAMLEAQGYITHISEMRHGVHWHLMVLPLNTDDAMLSFPSGV